MQNLLLALLLFLPPAVVIHLISRLGPEKPGLRSSLLGMSVGFVLMLFMLDPTAVYLVRSIPIGIAESLEIDPNTLWYRAFVLAGLYEETLKFLLLIAWVRFHRQMVWGDRAPERIPLWDVLIPAMWLAAGFSVVENAWYLWATARSAPDQLLSMALLRLVLVTPSHLVEGVFMGSLYGLALNPGPGRWLILPGALVLPVLVHGFWDVLAFSRLRWASVILLLCLLYLAFRAVRYLKAEEGRVRAA